MSVKHSICPSCSVGCGINLITVDGVAVGTYPYKRHPVNQGKNCLNGRKSFELVNESRINDPLIKNGVLKKSNWDEALNLVASKINDYAPEDIGIIGSGNCTNEDSRALKEFADSIGVKNIGYCAGNLGFNFETASLDDLENSKFILVIGDVIKENPLMGRRLILAREKGAELVTADQPGKTLTGINSDDYIQINSTSEFLDSIDPEILKKLTESSTIVANKLSDKSDFEKLHKISEDSKSNLILVMEDCNTRGTMESLKPLNEDEINDLIGNIKLLYVVGANPGEYADSIKNIEFLVTQGSSFNETVLMSDVVLPASCWAEKTGSFTNTTGMTQNFSKVVEASEDVMEDQEIIEKLKNRILKDK